MRWPSVERFIRGPAHRPGTGLVERTMRIAATDISRRAFIHFIRQRARTMPMWRTSTSPACGPRTP